MRRLKGPVVLSLGFGIFVAPFALYVASKAIHQHGRVVDTDPAILRQLILLRRLSIGLLVFWAFILGTRAAWLYSMR